MWIKSSYQKLAKLASVFLLLLLSSPSAFSLSNFNPPLRSPPMTPKLPSTAHTSWQAAQLQLQDRAFFSASQRCRFGVWIRCRCCCSFLWQRRRNTAAKLNREVLLAWGPGGVRWGVGGRGGNTFRSVHLVLFPARLKKTIECEEFWSWTSQLAFPKRQNRNITRTKFGSFVLPLNFWIFFIFLFF